MKALCAKSRDDVTMQVAVAIVASQSNLILLHTGQVTETGLCRRAISIAENFANEWNARAEKLEAESATSLPEKTAVVIPPGRELPAKPKALPADAPQKKLADTPVSELGLSDKIVGILTAAGIVTVGHIQDVEKAKSDEDGIEYVEDIGPASRKAILAAVATKAAELGVE